MDQLLAAAGFKIGVMVVAKGGSEQFKVKTWPGDCSFVHSKTIQLVTVHERKGEKTHAFVSATMLLDEYDAIQPKTELSKDK